jgi:hypothetical protein
MNFDVIGIVFQYSATSEDAIVGWNTRFSLARVVESAPMKAKGKPVSGQKEERIHWLILLERIAPLRKCRGIIIVDFLRICTLRSIYAQFFLIYPLLARRISVAEFWHEGVTAIRVGQKLVDRQSTDLTTSMKGYESCE